MKSTPTLRLVALASLACLSGAPALAQQEGGYTYGGLSLGQSRAQFDEQRIANNLLGAGVATSAISSDERDKGYKLFGGYQFNRNVALEAGYFDLGRFNFSSTTAPAGTFDGRLKIQGFNLDLVGTMPIGPQWSALARVGAQYAKTSDSFTGTGAALASSQSSHTRGTNVKYGVGLQYEFSPSMLMRGEVERYRINDAAGGHGNVNLASLSLVFPFGRTSAPAPRPVAYIAPAPAPAPVVIAPPPAVVVVAAPVAPVVVEPVRRRVTFSAESLFGFDKSALQPDGKTALDTFSKDLSGSQYDVIQVEGHTDRIGSPAYNQNLSVQRAEAVKVYLVESGRIDAGKISAHGKGETTPVTKAEDCKGNTANAKLIACLQPDRRVDIDVVGTR